MFSRRYYDTKGITSGGTSSSSSDVDLTQLKQRVDSLYSQIDSLTASFNRLSANVTAALATIANKADLIDTYKASGSTLTSGAYNGRYTNQIAVVNPVSITGFTPTYF